MDASYDITDPVISFGQKRRSRDLAPTTAEDRTQAMTEVSYVMRPSMQETKQDPNISTHPTKWVRTKVGNIQQLANVVAIKELLSFRSRSSARLDARLPEFGTC